MFYGTRFEAKSIEITPDHYRACPDFGLAFEQLQPAPQGDTPKATEGDIPKQATKPARVDMSNLRLHGGLVPDR